jgi:hypothetical protein
MDLRGASSRLLVAALAAVGCAPVARPLPPALLEEAGTHVYHRPARDVRAAVQAELASEGYVVAPVSDDGLVRTDWKMLVDGREFATFRDRYVVLVKRLTPHHARVEAMRITMSTLGSDFTKPLHMFVPADVNDKTPSFGVYGEGPERASMPYGVARDLAFEWRLFARLEPERARRAGGP